MLEAELIDSTRTTFYLNHLESLFREQAYLTHLNKRVSTQDDQKQVSSAKNDLSDFKLVDLDTLRRR